MPPGERPGRRKQARLDTDPAGPSSAPVVVVGGGPAGSALALLLARSGCTVTLVEAQPQQELALRGQALLPHGLEALEAMDLLPLPPAVASRPLAGWRVVLNGAELFRLEEPLEGPGNRGCTLIDQRALLELLQQELQRYPQATLRLGQRVSGLLRQGDRITGVALSDGSQLAARLVVGTDGRSSSLRRLAGLPLQRGAGALELLWGRLTPQQPCPLAEDFTTVVGGGDLFSLFSTAGGLVQIGWLPAGTSGHRAGTTPDTWAERLALASPPALAHWLRQHRDCDPHWSPLRVTVGMAERWWRPGLLLLGDAAHPMSPVRAQGLNLALRDACTAGQLLAPLLTAGAGAAAIDRQLARVEAQRRPETARLQRLQAAESRRGQLLQRQPLLRAALSGGRHWLGPLVAQRWRHEQLPLRRGFTQLPTSQP